MSGILLMILLIVNVESQQIGSLPIGSRCITTTLSGNNAKCKQGLECVIVHHGIPNTNIENMGTCVKLKRTKLKQCSVDYCTKVGHTGTCIDKYQPDFVVTKCYAFATRVDGGRRPNCSFDCGSPNCETGKSNRLRSNRGNWYCGLCALKRASCKSAFREFGPVVHGSNLDGRNCSTTNRNMKPCLSKSVCLVNSFGTGQIGMGNNGDGDDDDVVHSKGICVPNRPFVTCTLNFCAQHGKFAYCQTPLDKILTQCGVWANRTDFGLKPDCQQTCVRSAYCQVPPVIDSKGKKYCSRCHLRKASCESKFDRFASMPPVIAQNYWLCSTRNPTQGETKCKKGSGCLIKHFGLPIIGFSNAGICTPKNNAKYQRCTPKFCDKKMKNEEMMNKFCITIDTNDWTTCDGWRNRSDAGL